MKSTTLNCNLVSPWDLSSHLLRSHGVDKEGNCKYGSSKLAMMPVLPILCVRENLAWLFHICLTQSTEEAKEKSMLSALEKYYLEVVGSYSTRRWYQHQQDLPEPDLESVSKVSRSRFLCLMALMRIAFKIEMVVKGTNMSITNVNIVPILAWWK